MPEARLQRTREAYDASFDDGWSHSPNLMDLAGVMLPTGEVLCGCVMTEHGQIRWCAEHAKRAGVV